MRLQIGNKIVTRSLVDILTNLKAVQPGDYLTDIIDKKDNILITCPFHSDGHEQRPGCFVYNRDDNNQVMKGTYNCFVCGAKGPFWKIVNQCFNFDLNDEFGKQWLIDNYGDIWVEEEQLLPEISLGKESFILEESALSKYDYANEKAIDYLINKRHIRKEVIEYFQLGYNIITDSIIFPIRNIQGKLIGISERCIEQKKFNLPKIDKPCYLLNEAKKYNTVIICEGQFDALSAWSFGFPAVCLFGSGTTDKQINELNKSGIAHFILMYDNDQAGRKGAARFKNLIAKDRLITDIYMPKGKDINDLTEEEFYSLIRRYKCSGNI